MAGNSFGKIFRLTSFGESHGPAIGGVIDGCPSKLDVDFDFIRSEMIRRKTNSSAWASKRAEPDQVEFLSGISEGKTTGTPLAFIIRNKDARSEDYNKLKDIYRPSHADFTYQQKYGIRDHKGGGRASARETAVRVVAGAIAKQFLKKFNINIHAYVSAIGDLKLKDRYYEFNPDLIEESEVRCPDKDLTQQILQLLDHIKNEQDSIGGMLSCKITNLPVGLGDPVYNKMNADLAKAMLSINAVKGIDFGVGFEGLNLRGSDHNDPFVKSNDGIRTKTNNDGGIQGGITNGMDINFSVALKPPSSIGKQQQSLDVHGNFTSYQTGGRHDACIVPRAVPIVEAMAALVLTDHYLIHNAYH